MVLWKAEPKLERQINFKLFSVNFQFIPAISHPQISKATISMFILQFDRVFFIESKTFYWLSGTIKNVR